MVRPVTEADTGLKTVYGPSEEGSSNGLIDIVAIHGIGAHPDDTWSKKVTTGDNGCHYVNWLKDQEMLPSVAPNARIMRYGYESQWFGDDTVRLTASTIAEQLLWELISEREKFPFRPLIFIAHCYGGLVVLKALRLAFDDTHKWPGIFRFTAGLVFFGTPFRGTEGMKQSEMIEAALNEYRPDQVQGDSLRILGPGDELLQDILDRFLETRKEPNPAQVACFYETKSSNVGAIVGGKAKREFIVNESSGCLDPSSTIGKYPLSRTHFDINKFGTPLEQSYKLVRRVIKEFVVSAQLRHDPLQTNNSPLNTTIPIAKVTIDEAYHKLRQSITSIDATVFQSTTLEDVWKAAEEIELLQREKRSLQNSNRIKPLLKALKEYSGPIERLCNEPFYLPFVWAPIKLMLELSDGHADIFDKLMHAYAQMAQAMPQIDGSQNALNSDPGFCMAVALVYADIVEFHCRTYEFFRRRAWDVFFDSLWKSFDSRRNAIINSLVRHRELLNKEVAMVDTVIVKARQRRERLEEELMAEEKRKSNTYIHDTVAWLNIATEHQDERLDRLSSKRLMGTCEWISRNAKMTSWKDDPYGEPVLWIKGIPGAGKTILCTYLIQRIQGEQRITTAYYICNSYTSGKNLSAEIMRSLTLQLLRQNKELAIFTFENYANKGFPPSVSHLRNLLKSLLSTIPMTRICIDGLDEYPRNEQRSLLQELLPLAKQTAGHCKILISSRDVDEIRKALQNRPAISFSDEKDALDRDIQAYVRSALTGIREKFRPTTAQVDEIQRRIIDKADGMFLWVRLVIISLNKCGNVKELRESVDTLPEGLGQAYERILKRIFNEMPNMQAPRGLRILEWLACSLRPLKIYEIQDGINFHTDNTVLTDETRLPYKIIDLCKPLIEEGPENTVDFVHYSAKEYILDRESGPFLSYVDAHYNIAFACVTYLNTAFCFHNLSTSMDDLRIRVAKGFHGLHPYANEFWFQHLLQYAKCAKDLDSPCYQLDAGLEELTNFWKSEPGSIARATKLDDTTTADGIRGQAKVLADAPWVEGMGLDILMFRAYMSQEKFAHQDADAIEKRELSGDPTYFSKASKEYQNIVQFLLDCPASSLPQGLTESMVNYFKSRYADTAFICRYPSCQRHSKGFGSTAKRDEHEMSHVKPLRCADSSCEFFERGFTSRSGLIKHNRKYHPAPEDTDPPKFEPRKEEPPPPPPPPSPPPQVAPPVEPPRVEPPKQAAPVQKKVYEAAPVQKARRISRARKGQKVHGCQVCPKVYTRAEGLRRHKLNHLPPSLFCHYSDCGHSFRREDLLARHIKQHEPTKEVAHDTQAAASALAGLGAVAAPIGSGESEESQESQESQESDGESSEGHMVDQAGPSGYYAAS